jgi:hypothetical protein
MARHAAAKQDKIILELRTQREILSSKCSKMDPEEYHLCSHADDRVNACTSYAFPEAKWRNGDCPLADMVLRSDVVTKKGKIRIGQKKGRKKKNRF